MIIFFYYGEIWRNNYDGDDGDDMLENSLFGYLVFWKLI